MAERTILVVDDEVDVLEMIETGLRAAGYRIYLADSGERAIELFERHPADLVICDIRMPGMDGITVITRLREHDPDLPVVVLTGHLTDNTVEQCDQLGGINVLGKPFLFRELSKAVQVGLRRR
ncbi:MAG: response regulator [Deltaproteobacteria bacterium]|nr:MAG: response regulator [Deltaproteobacteria bacterium]TMQ06257.1 MAG: response regulator [Deltaproteobacteria bacterium]